ncbi:hypothetical protein EDWATA_00316 [Edwardsiella tarda ATCC 23685]|uniref:Uncharacterized protein n=1 Tax=Edwardsiella tarda ATCC 23685 TaxID=500638 RepID=D4F0T6_EDWTA|nr:hypothetical protein EDWATA_00316 [Edwardsiella tarda ATCC 23685]
MAASLHNSSRKRTTFFIEKCEPAQIRRNDEQKNLARKGRLNQ